MLLVKPPVDRTMPTCGPRCGILLANTVHSSAAGALAARSQQPYTIQGQQVPKYKLNVLNDTWLTGSRVQRLDTV
eukprot:350071-Chlamydomonas_euryale.AAC.3